MIRIKCLLIIMTLSVVMAACVPSQPTYYQSSRATPIVPPPVLTSSPPAQINTKKVDYIVVQKANRVVTLWKEGRIVKTYPIMSLGPNPIGHKIYEGDNRTPEGLYTIDRKHPSQRFQKFLNISYPNAQDRAKAESLGMSPGGAVGLHGDKGGMEGFFQRFKKDWTEGCIAMRNADIEEIYEWVEVGTPILIKP